MCNVCKEIEDKTPAEALKIIGKAFTKRGKMSSHLSSLMDRVLGTRVEEKVNTREESEAFKAMKQKDVVDEPE
jgi:hypothetical protein